MVSTKNNYSCLYLKLTFTILKIIGNFSVVLQIQKQEA